MRFLNCLIGAPLEDLYEGTARSAEHERRPVRRKALGSEHGQVVADAGDERFGLSLFGMIDHNDGTRCFRSFSW
jgi:hypothetical protein